METRWIHTDEYYPFYYLKDDDAGFPEDKLELDPDVVKWIEETMHQFERVQLFLKQQLEK